GAELVLPGGRDGGAGQAPGREHPGRELDLQLEQVLRGLPALKQSKSRPTLFVTSPPRGANRPRRELRPRCAPRSCTGIVSLPPPAVATPGPAPPRQIFRAHSPCPYGAEQFGVRKPCLRLLRPQHGCGQIVGAARLRPPKRERGSRTPKSA